MKQRMFIRVFPVLASLAAPLAVRGALAAPNLDWESISPAARAELVSAVVLDRIEFRETPLSDCLRRLSQMTKEAIGRGFSISMIGKPSLQSEPITMTLESMNVRDVLKQLGQVSGSRIEMTGDGCVVTFAPEPAPDKH
jgi:hypothetical protein